MEDSEIYPNFFTQYDEKLANFTYDDEHLILDGETPIPFLNNIRVWELAGLFLAASVVLVFVLFTFARLVNRPNYNDSSYDEFFMRQSNNTSLTSADDSVAKLDNKINVSTTSLAFKSNDNLSLVKIDEINCQNQEVVLKINNLEFSNRCLDLSDENGAQYTSRDSYA